MSHRADPKTCRPLEIYYGDSIFVIPIYFFTGLHREEQGTLWRLICGNQFSSSTAQTQVSRLGGKHFHPAHHLASSLFCLPTAQVTQSSFRDERGINWRRQRGVNGKQLRSCWGMSFQLPCWSFIMFKSPPSTPHCNSKVPGHVSPLFPLPSLFSSSSYPFLKQLLTNLLQTFWVAISINEAEA